MILNIILLIFTVLISVRCSSVMDSLSQKTIYVSNYCPQMKYCKEGTHVMCMYYDHNQKFGPRCSNHVNAKITPKMVEQVLKTVNFIRSRLATGQETGKDNQLLPRAYGMMRIGWDSELATLAQVLANQCLGGREDECRATDKFPNPSQSIAIIQFKFPNWEYLTQNTSKHGLHDEKLAFAVEKYLKALYALKKSVTKEMIIKCPSMIKLPKYYSRLYLNLIRGDATHIGCGMSAYTRYSIGKSGTQSIHNCVEMVCNLSDRPQPLTPVYNTEPPLPGLGYSDECGCPKGYKETSGCLCEEDHGDTPTASWPMSNLTQEKGLPLQWLDTDPLPELPQSQSKSQPQAQPQTRVNASPLTQLQERSLARSQSSPQVQPQSQPQTRLQEQPEAKLSRDREKPQTQPIVQPQDHPKAQTQSWARVQPQVRLQAQPDVNTQEWLKAQTQSHVQTHSQSQLQAQRKIQPQTSLQTQLNGQPQDWLTALKQVRVQAETQALPNPLIHTQTCSNAMGNCESQVLLLPIFSIEDAPTKNSVDRSHQIEKNNFLSSGNTTILPKDKTKLSDFERLYEEVSGTHESSPNDMNAQVLQNNPNNKRIKSQIYDSDAEYSIIPRGSFPNEEIMVTSVSNKKPKKPRINPQVYDPEAEYYVIPRQILPNDQIMISSEFTENPKKEKTKLLDLNLKLSTHEESPNTLIEKQELKDINTLKKPKKIKGASKSEHPSERNLIEQHRYSNQTNISLKGDTINRSDKDNNDDTKIMSIIDNLEQEIKHIDLNGNKKEIHARMRKIYEIMQNKFTGATQPDDIKSDFTEFEVSTVLYQSDNAAKDTKLNTDNNLHEKYDGEDVPNDNLDDTLIKMLGHSVDNENVYQDTIDSANNANNDNFYPKNTDNIGRTNNENLYHGNDDDDEFEYKSLISRNQETLNDFYNKDIVKRKSNLDIMDLGKYIGELGNVNSGIDRISYHGKNIEKKHKNKDDKPSNIFAKNNDKIFSRRKFTYFDNPGRKVRNSRTFRPIMDVLYDNPPMRRMQEDEVHTRSTLQSNEDDILGNRAIL